MEKNFVINNFVNNQFIEPTQDNFLPIYNPATGETIGKVYQSSEHDVVNAVAVAQEAFNSWKNTSPTGRSKYLESIAQILESKLEEFAQLETINTGKPLWLTRRTDIPRAATNFRFFAHAATQFFSESHPIPGHAINFTLRQPIGTVGCISPWNLPLYLFTWKIAPALAAGNTVVAKPSEMTPLTAFKLGEVILESGLPPGVLNIIHGTGPDCGEAIVQHRVIKAISFTGSTAVGKRIAGICAQQLKKCSLELGGKNPHIIFNDVDLERAAQIAVEAAFTNQGQICLCGSRLLIQRDIYEAFKRIILGKVKNLKVGDPLLEENFLGALVSENHLRKIESYVNLAREEGGKVLCGGEKLIMQGRCKDGWFFPATLIENLTPNARCNHEEIFGPILTLLPFGNEEEAISIANLTDYGLAAVIQTNDLNRALRVSERLETGIVWVNTWMLRDLRTPFGGVKNSGLGREGGFEAMRFFTEAKNICIKYA